VTFLIGSIVVVSFSAPRTNFTRPASIDMLLPITREFSLDLIDAVILPALPGSP
jgi:hypothetical protein